MYKIINTILNKIVEEHSTRDSAEQAVRWLNEHEQRWSNLVAGGDKYAMESMQPGRPYTYHIEEVLVDSRRNDAA